MSLPPNWEIHESKSHPGAFYYFNTYDWIIHLIHQGDRTEYLDRTNRRSTSVVGFIMIIAISGSLLSYSQEACVSFYLLLLS